MLGGWVMFCVVCCAVKNSVFLLRFDVNGSFYLNKPIGAAPGREYHLLKIVVVAKRMVCTTINLVGTLHVCTS